MPVILLDPDLPDLIPVRAVSFMSGHVFVTEDVNPALLWNIPSYEFASGAHQVPFGAVVLSSDRAHPLVLQMISHGDQVIVGDEIPGTRLLAAVALMDRLRRTGPWEQQQTHDSLRRYLLEEVYELLDAFDSGDHAELRSELGDLLLQVLFHARIAEDSAQDAFSIDDVAQSFVDKVSYRTPGILSGEHADLERQIREWEERKAAERNRGSVLDGLVTSQPALALTQKLFERLASADFPRDAISPSLTRVDIPVRKHARDSAEDQQRRRVLQLIEQVRAAEDAAVLDGVTPRHEDTWRKYLGMSFDPPVEPLSPVEPVETEHINPWAAEYTSGFATAAPGATHDTRNDFDHEFDAESSASGFPEAEDFPGPPDPIETVGADPIKAGERKVKVRYTDDVPKMIVRSERDDAEED
ncbi:MAG: MazG family protein [Gordonia sp. (in: high G+C Gram-positive bacteria)]|uniref:MazG family protein n=1 Tax=Gordonia sp. (in: high G+C Gram-positive bacteria) TaxID=84139 RepID=UPI003BB5749A